MTTSNGEVCDQHFGYVLKIDEALPLLNRRLHDRDEYERPRNWTILLSVVMLALSLILYFNWK